MGTFDCIYETPCHWCSKWDKKCDKKIPERGQRAKCNLFDDAIGNSVAVTDDDFGFNIYTNKPFVVDPTTCQHSWGLVKVVTDPVLMQDKHYFMCDICTLVKYEVTDVDI